jgi:transcriptional regulator with XRE-family HTH domain
MGQFLTSRRRQLVRADLGLPEIAGRKTRGLRREEVAYLAGVSVTWYTWLEQGRDVTPSRQVVDSLARTLRLSHAEHVYLSALAGHSAPQPAEDPSPGTVPAHLHRLLDALADYPALVIAPDWAILAWNAVYEALYPNVATVAAADRNFLWLLFTDPYLRTLMPDWERTGLHNVASFRAEAGTRLGEPPFADLVSRLLQTSEAFRSAWESYDVETLPSRERLFRHPVVGDLHLEQHSLAPSDHPHLQLVTFIPIPSTDTAERLGRLRDRQAVRLTDARRQPGQTCPSPVAQQKVSATTVEPPTGLHRVTCGKS